MAITMQQTGRTVRLSVKGFMASGKESGSLRHEVAKALKAGAERIVVDASGLGFLDAAGLGELVDCRAMARQAGAKFRLSGVVGKTLEILRVTGLDRIFARDNRSGEDIPRIHRHVA